MNRRRWWTLRGMVGTVLVGAMGAGCGGKGGEPLVISTPVLEDESDGERSGDSGLGAGDSGLQDGSGQPDGDFWYVATLSGGDAARPEQYFDGDAVQVTTGSARLAEGASDFVIELRYVGSAEGVPFEASCQVPIEHLGGLPATAADDPSGNGPVGCAAIDVSTTRYGIEPDGLTVVTQNDGTVVSAEFSLITQSDGGGFLQATGAFEAVLCDAFWGGSPCTY